MESTTYCTYCGKKTIYKGIRICNFKGQVYYDSGTGKPFKEHYFECPDVSKFWSGADHDTFTNPCLE